MVIEDEVNIIIHPRNMKHFKKMGYGDDIMVYENIKVKISDLNVGSHIIITCQCDICGKIKKMEYRKYLSYNNEFGKYYCRKCSQFKLEETNLKLYGEKYPSQRKDVLDKMKKTCLEKYGVENASQSKDFQDKKIETNRKNFGCDWGLSNENIKEKSKKTCLKKYGVEYISQSEENKFKVKKTKKIRYDNENYNNREKSKQTCLEKYGVEHSMQIDSVKEKGNKTRLEKYGSEHALQNEEIYKNMIRNSFSVKQFENTPLYYQGTYEKNFLDRYYNNFIITNGKTIKYEIDGKKHKYYPDFYIPNFNLIVEIKSKIWYDRHIIKNLAKEKECKRLGYNFIFIVDKNYEEFEKITI